MKPLLKARHKKCGSGALPTFTHLSTSRQFFPKKKIWEKLTRSIVPMDVYLVWKVEWVCEYQHSVKKPSPLLTKQASFNKNAFPKGGSRAIGLFELSNELEVLHHHSYRCYFLLIGQNSVTWFWTNRHWTFVEQRYRVFAMYFFTYLTALFTLPLL